MLTKSEATTLPAAASRRPGNVLEVAALAYPVVLQTFSDTLMQVVDSAFVGRIGATELGAVGFSGIWLWTTLCAFFGTATGVQTFVAQAFGAKREHECGAWVWQAMWLMLPVIVVWTLIVSAGFESLLRLLGPTPEMQARALEYAEGRFPGMPAIIVGGIMTACLRGLGMTRLPMLAAVVANLVNVGLDYGLIFGRLGLPEWGVYGAGAATSAAQWTYVALMLVATLRPAMAQRFGTWAWRPHAGDLRRYFRTSVPIGGQWLLDMASFAIFSTIIARMGDISMAANQAMMQLLSLSFMQAYGLSVASGALVGRYVGARDLESAERSHRSAMRLGTALTTAVAIAFLSLPDPLIGIFSEDPEVLALGRPLLALAAVFQVVDAIGIIVGGSLRGAGDTRWPFLVQATMAWGLRLPVVWVAAVLLQGGLFGAWFGELVYISALNAAFWLRFRHGAWRTMRV